MTDVWKGHFWNIFGTNCPLEFTNTFLILYRFDQCRKTSVQTKQFRGIKHYTRLFRSEWTLCLWSTHQMMAKVISSISLRLDDSNDMINSSSLHIFGKTCSKLVPLDVPINPPLWASSGDDGYTKRCIDMILATISFGSYRNIRHLYYSMLVIWPVLFWPVLFFPQRIKTLQVPSIPANLDVQKATKENHWIKRVEYKKNIIFPPRDLQIYHLSEFIYSLIPTDCGSLKPIWAATSTGLERRYPVCNRAEVV